MPDYDNYCDFSASAAQAVAGKDIILQVWDALGSNLLAIAGQQGLTINRSTDSIEVTSKDTEGGWKAKIAGMKEWSIDSDGAYVASDSAHQELSSAYDEGRLVCLKVVKKAVSNGVTSYSDMFGGLAIISDYSLEAPFDDAMTYSLSLDGNGPLTDLATEVAHTYTQAELEAMTKSEIAEIAMARGYTTVSEDDVKDTMITAFLAEQSA